jgi:Protein of unknown function (DUF1269)
MDPNTPVVLAAAKYASRDDAEHGFKTVWGAKHEGEFDHMSLAVLTKDANGQLQEERHDSTAKHLAWGGVALGAALALVAPPVGVGMLAAGALGGAGAIVGHFWHQISKQDLMEISDLLESGESAIVVVAVNHKKTDITPLLKDAEKSIVIETRAGDIDTEFEKALKNANATAT